APAVLVVSQTFGVALRGSSGAGIFLILQGQVGGEALCRSQRSRERYSDLVPRCLGRVNQLFKSVKPWQEWRRARGGVSSRRERPPSPARSAGLPRSRCRSRARSRGRRAAGSG